MSILYTYVSKQNVNTLKQLDELTLTAKTFIHTLITAKKSEDIDQALQQNFFEPQQQLSDKDKDFIKALNETKTPPPVTLFYGEENSPTNTQIGEDSQVEGAPAASAPPAEGADISSPTTSVG